MLSGNKFPDPAKLKVVWLVEFYTSASPTARDFKDKFVTLAQQLAKNGVKAGAVSCDSDAAICRRTLGTSFNSRRMPMFAVLTSEGANIYEGEGGKLSPKDLYDFVVASIPQEVQNLRLVPQLEEFVSSKCSDKKQASYGIGVILLTSKFETSLFIKAIAHSLTSKAVVAEIRGSNNLLAKELGLGNQPAFPILVAVCGGSDIQAVLRFEGDLKDTDKVIKWIEGKFGSSRSTSACKGLQQKANEMRKARAKRQEGAKRLTLAELRKKKIKELREMAEDLQVAMAGLVEKDDYVGAVARKLGIKVAGEL